MHSYQFLVVDDHPLYREAVVNVLIDLYPQEKVSECGQFSEVDQLIQEHSPDLILLDLNMPGVHGLSGLQHIRSHYPDVAVAIVSAEENKQLVLQALALGAVGYVPKSLPKQALGQAIEQILAGDLYMPAELLRQTSLQQSDGHQLHDMLKALTRKQLLVLEQLAQGRSNKQIGEALNLSESTIKTHVSEILRRLGVENRVQAANQASSIDFSIYL
jgi:DNA-binding NarL/FixJ family response regulator